MSLNVLDLYCGWKSWSSPAEERGHAVVTLDIHPKFKPTFTKDIMLVLNLADLSDRPFDLIFASPPCEAYSVGSIFAHWDHGMVPKDEAAIEALMITRHTFFLIDLYVRQHPFTFYVIENPLGLMRNVSPRQPNGTTWYCQWGERRAKPTDLWTNAHLFPDNSWPKCHNGALDHDQQSRSYSRRVELGQNGGTEEGLDDAESRAAVPEALALAFIKYVERQYGD